VSPTLLPVSTSGLRSPPKFVVGHHSDDVCGRDSVAGDVPRLARGEPLTAIGERSVAHSSPVSGRASATRFTAAPVMAPAAAVAFRSTKSIAVPSSTVRNMTGIFR
jgi:hypothetical protein